MSYLLAMARKVRDLISLRIDLHQSGAGKAAHFHFAKGALAGQAQYLQEGGQLFS
jgi:hypothetical protein